MKNQVIKTIVYHYGSLTYLAYSKVENGVEFFSFDQLTWVLQSELTRLFLRSDNPQLIQGEFYDSPILLTVQGKENQ